MTTDRQKCKHYVQTKLRVYIQHMGGSETDKGMEPLLEVRGAGKRNEIQTQNRCLDLLQLVIRA